MPFHSTDMNLPVEPRPGTYSVTSRSSYISVVLQHVYEANTSSLEGLYMLGRADNSCTIHIPLSMEWYMSQSPKPPLHRVLLGTHASCHHTHIAWFASRAWRGVLCIEWWSILGTVDGLLASTCT